MLRMPWLIDSFILRTGLIYMSTNWFVYIWGIFYKLFTFIKCCIPQMACIWGGKGVLWRCSCCFLFSFLLRLLGGIGQGLWRLNRGAAGPAEQIASLHRGCLQLLEPVLPSHALCPQTNSSLIFSSNHTALHPFLYPQTSKNKFVFQLLFCLIFRATVKRQCGQRPCLSWCLQNPKPLWSNKGQENSLALCPLSFQETPPISASLLGGASPPFFSHALTHLANTSQIKLLYL